MELRDVIKNRRSIRKFKREKIPEYMLEKLVECAMYAPSARNRRPVHLIVVEDPKTIGELRNLRKSAFSFLESAPLALIVASENVDTWESDSAIVASYIQLCAVDLGLGSCWGHIVNRVEKEVRDLLGIPGDVRILCVIGLGFPDEEKPPHTESEIDKNRIHRGRW